jgi:CheY-like chemotaxis protein
MGLLRLTLGSGPRIRRDAPRTGPLCEGGHTAGGQARVDAVTRRRIIWGDTPEGCMSRKLILLVDDDRDTLDAYAVLFQALGHVTAAASDGPDAVAAVLRLRPDLMLLDLGLPRMSGFEVLERIRSDAHGARLPVIVLTGRAFANQVAELHQHGCLRVLIKPCEPVALCQAVEEALHAPPQLPAPREDRPVNGALRVRTSKPRNARRRPVESTAPRSLEALCLWSDFLGRRSEGLRETAAALVARAVELRERIRLRSTPRA